MTTSAARCRLYTFLNQVQEGGGELLYMDTGIYNCEISKFINFCLDSIIYKYQGQRPIQTGKNLGDMMDEYPKHRILEFVGGGCKNYSLRIRKKNDKDAEDEFVIKVFQNKFFSNQSLSVAVFV